VSSRRCNALQLCCRVLLCAAVCCSCVAGCVAVVLQGVLQLCCCQLQRVEWCRVNSRRCGVSVCVAVVL